MIKKRIINLTIVVFILFQVLPFIQKKPISIPKTNFKINPGFFSFLKPFDVNTANLASVSATLSNPRFSYYAKVSGAHSANDTTILIQSSSNPDNDTTHLFPNDTVSVGPNPDLTVGSIIDSTNFALQSGLTVGASDGDPVYATQSGSLTVQLTLNNMTIPANGYIQVTIPAVNTGNSQNDGSPDTAATVAANGFDANGIADTDIATSGGTGCTWTGSETWTVGTNSTDHIYKQVTSTPCTGGTVIVTIDNNPGLVNPAPSTADSLQGVAEVYNITVGGYDSGDQPVVPVINTKVAPVEGVLVSATVDESLQMYVCGVNGSTRAAVGDTSNCYSSPPATICGNATLDVNTNPYGVDFGSNMSSDTFYDASQFIKINTNAPSGYSVTIEENDQMGKDGITCTGASAGESDSCIKDTTGDDGTADQNTVADWNTPSDTDGHGLGYSLENESSDTDATFDYLDTSNFATRQIPDLEASEQPVQIMSNTGPVSGSGAFVCYRLAFSATQPAGYYFNKIKYTAVASF